MSEQLSGLNPLVLDHLLDVMAHSIIYRSTCSKGLVLSNWFKTGQQEILASVRLFPADTLVFRLRLRQECLFNHMFLAQRPQSCFFRPSPFYYHASSVAT